MYSPYPWQQPYLEALRETDESKLHRDILEATASIEQRLLSPIDPRSEEYREIQNTRRGLQALRARRFSHK